MAMYSDRKINRKWRRIFRILYAIAAVGFFIPFLSLNDVLEIFLTSTFIVTVITGLVLLWFMYNMPEKLNMLDEKQNEF